MTVFLSSKNIFTSLYILYIYLTMLHLCTQIPLSKCTSCICTFPLCLLCIVSIPGCLCMGSSHAFDPHLPSCYIAQAMHLHNYYGHQTRYILTLISRPIYVCMYILCPPIATKLVVCTHYLVVATLVNMFLA